MASKLTPLKDGLGDCHKRLMESILVLRAAFNMEETLRDMNIIAVDSAIYDNCVHVKGVEVRNSFHPNLFDNIRKDGHKQNFLSFLEK